MWSPSITGLITKLESVQRRFTKSLSGMSSFSYSERLCLLNLDPLEMRRLRADLMLCFKIMKGFVDEDASEFCERVPLYSRHSDCVFILFSISLLCLLFFYVFNCILQC